MRRAGVTFEFRFLRLIAALALVSGAGCGETETGRQHPTVFTPSDLSHSVGTTTTFARSRPQTVEVHVLDPEPISTTVLVTAKAGGLLTAGRHQLRIPAGALKYDTEITLRDMSGMAGFVTCEAYPEGLEFLVPVQLQTTFGDLKQPSRYTVFWIANPGSSDETWIDMHAVLSADGMGLTTELTHFSTYAPGKAGWGPRRDRGSKTNFEEMQH
jgi:hypothetical protein